MKHYQLSPLQHALQPSAHAIVYADLRPNTEVTLHTPFQRLEKRASESIIHIHKQQG
jgi:hypothetical protein